jgi:hypothetical protein
MPLLADRVRETSATTGTGTMTLAGAVAGYQGFNAAFANGATVYYVIHYATEWEVGIGTVGTGTLARNTVLQSSNGDALVPFSAGTKDVFVAYVAERAVTTSDAATLTNKTIDDYTNNIGANSTHFRVKASGSLPKGTVVKASGFTPGEQAITVVAVASASDIAIGVMEQTLTSGQFGMAVVIGELFDVNTNAFAFNDVLYSNGAGGLTATKPASGLYQTIGTVVRVNSSNGVIAVNIVAPMYVEATTNTANTSVLRDGSGNFAAGTVTAALSGNASTATALQTARNINGVSFNGSADITVTAAAGTLTGSTLASGVTASSLTSVGTLTSLGVSGNLTVDTNTLFVDAANNLVGIRTTTPTQPFDVNGTSRLNGTVFLGNGNPIDLAGGSYFRASTSGFSVNNAADTLTLLQLTNAGNAGLGVTPSAWATANGQRALQITSLTALWTGASGAASLGFNVYESGTNAYTYTTTNPSTAYQQDGAHKWFTAPSGTAGNAISFTQAMTLDASGNLGLGTTSISYRLDAVGVFSSVVARLLRSGDYGEVLRFGRNGVDEGASIGYPASGVFAINTGSSGGTERARFTAAGNFTIGGTTDSARVRIEGTTNLTSAIQVFRSGNSCGAIWQEASAMRFGTDGSTGFTEKLRVDNTTTAGQTALLLWDVDNGTMERVTVGAADSGGVGFKVLRIPN